MRCMTVTKAVYPFSCTSACESAMSSVTFMPDQQGEARIPLVKDEHAMALEGCADLLTRFAALS